MDTDLTGIADQLSQQLIPAELNIAVAESCTGGWVAKVLTDIPGSSAWFDRGYVTYSNAAKQQMLGVPARLLQNEGAVSEAVVEAMVQGVLTFSDADVALAISGIAGPGGGSEERPVGSVWFAWGHAGQRPITSYTHFDGDRESVRRQAVAAALRGMLELIEG